jgi:hypothetical protein
MSLSNTISTKKEYTQALFLDNDTTQIRLVRERLPRIETIQIPESELLLPSSLEKIQRELESISGHTFASNKYIERAFRIRKYPNHLYDPVSGIQESHIHQVDAWMERTRRDAHRALLVDWDRTISVFEGYIGDDEGEMMGDRIRYYEDVLVFLLGGAPRLAALRAMFARAHAEGVHLYVVTNNTGCNDIPSGFNHFVKQLFQTIPYVLICGNEYGGHKGRALASYPEFARLQVRTGGGIHRSRRQYRRPRRRHTMRLSRRK